MFKENFHLICNQQLGNSTSGLKNINDGQAYGQINIHANAATGNIFIEDSQQTVIDLGFNIQLGLVYNSQATKTWQYGFIKKLLQLPAKNQ